MWGLRLKIWPVIDSFDTIRDALRGEGRPSSDYDLNRDVVLPAGRKLRPAGVLVAVMEGRDGFEVILTKRAATLKHHPGQIAFPGGKQEETDRDVEAAALREAEEEIGLPQGQVEVLGRLPAHETVTGFSATPVIARVVSPFSPALDRNEVDEMFHVPLAHVLNPANYQIQSRRWRGQQRAYYAIPYGPYYIWGATARMLRAWTDRMFV